MPSPRDKFATAITCIDGRVQQPIVDWMKLHTNVHYVDLITEPGPDRLRALIGYEPQVDLDTGLRQTADWYRERGLL